MPHRRLRRTLTQVAATFACTLGACADGTEPARALEPRLALETPSSDATIGDTLVSVRGVAEAPGRVDWVSLAFNGVVLRSSPDSSFDYGRQFVYQFRLKPNGEFAPRTHVEFVALLRVPPGAQTLTVEMDYRLPGEESPIDPHRLSVRIPFTVYRAPRLSLTGGIADTIYSRSLSLRGGLSGLATKSGLELVIDPGTSAERRVSDVEGTNDLILRTPMRGDSIAWRIDLPDTLGDGQHRLVLRVRDEKGVADSVVRSFVTHVPDVSYRLAVLPDLGGDDADALDLNAAGDVAGWVYDAARVPQAVVWRAGALVRLSTPDPSVQSRAFALNDRGDVVGLARDTMRTGSCVRAVHWRDGDRRYLPPAPPSCAIDWAAIDVNEAGQMLVRTGGSAMSDAFLVRGDVAERVTNLVPAEMNDLGQLVGQAVPCCGNGLPYARHVGVDVAVTGLRVPPGTGHTSSEHLGINERSQIIGAFGAGSLKSYYLAQPGQATLDLTSQLGGSRSNLRLVRIRDDGTVLFFDLRSSTAYRWRDGRVSRVRVITPGYRLDAVSSMNDAGQIAGHATELATGRGRAVLLSP